jgi:magnesium transporter
VASKNRNRRKHRLIQRRTPPGSSPGLVVVDPNALKPTIRLIGYSGEQYEQLDDATLDQLRGMLRRHRVLWVDVEGLGDAHLIEQLGELFQLHRLALEDVVNVHQRAKMEDYGNWLYYVTPMVTTNGGDRFLCEQVSLFLNDHVVLTFQEGKPGDAFDAVRARLQSGTKIRTLGSDYLAYSIIDALIDGYFPVLERYGEKLDVLEDAMLANGRPIKLIDELHDVRHDLRHLRRAIWPQREATAALLRDSTPFITAETRVYLRDCYDHVVQLIDLTETFRELSADLRDLYMSSVSNRINETMRVLTIISTIFIPLTFIAGVYGMNFDPNSSPLNMPELKWYYGYPATIAFMVVTTALMFIWFVQKGWISFETTTEKQK